MSADLMMSAEMKGDLGMKDGVDAADVEEGRIKERTSLGWCIGDHNMEPILQSNIGISLTFNWSSREPNSPRKC